MKSLRHLIAVFLLGAFALVQVPRELLHQCIGAEHPFSISDNGCSVSEDCPICDHALPVLIEHRTVSLATSERWSCDMGIALVSGTVQTVSDAYTSRGPPLI